MANIAVLRCCDLSPSASSQFNPLESQALQSLFPRGLARGAIAEVSGRRSSGRTSIGLHILAQATARGEVCAVVDLNDNFHPASAAAAEVELSRVIWVRCAGNAEHALRATDLLLHAGGFGVVLLDLCEAHPRVLNRIPLSYWYRFRQAIAPTPTILLLLTSAPQAKSCSNSSLDLIAKAFDWVGKAPFLRLRGMRVNAVGRKPAAGRVESLSISAVA
jgi:hypothetical protein